MDRFPYLLAKSEQNLPVVGTEELERRNDFALRYARYEQTPTFDSSRLASTQ